MKKGYSLVRSPGSKIWKVYFVDHPPKKADGSTNRVCRSTGKTEYREADKFAREVAEAARLANDGQMSHDKAHAIIGRILEKSTGQKIENKTLRQFAESYLENKNITRDTRTHERYAGIVKDFINFTKKGEQAIEFITTSDVEQWRNASRKKGRAAATVNLELKTIRAMFAAALNRGLIKLNPAAAGVVDVIEDDSEDKDAFTPEQLATLLAVAEGEWKGLILVAAYTGKRLGDVKTLKWDNVDLSAGKSGMIIWKPEKGKSKKRYEERPMHWKVSAYMNEKARTDNPSPFVFPSLAERPIGGRNGISQEFTRKIMPAAGIDPKRREKTGEGRATAALPFHSLRHFFSTELKRAGVDEATRMEIIGQTNAKVNQIYSHTNMEDMRKAIDKLP